MALQTIDVCAVLRSAVNQNYGNLVTRDTGMAVRHQIERELMANREGGVTSLDFSSIGLMDYSCADEVVAKLLVLLQNDDIARGGYVVFRGIGEDHLELVESVLKHHDLALVCLCEDGIPRLIGRVSEAERRAWEMVRARGKACPADLADEFGFGEDFVAEVLDGLSRRRLVRRGEDTFLALDPSETLQ
ncbi:MAG: hypothetical protein H3C62_12180 [Gemmatimonadaceae bacterium]|nr:hypothetical protein [Gemmatimonadaceae bacterium]